MEILRWWIDAREKPNRDETFMLFLNRKKWKGTKGQGE